MVVEVVRSRERDPRGFVTPGGTIYNGLESPGQTVLSRHRAQLVELASISQSGENVRGIAIELGSAPLKTASVPVSRSELKDRFRTCEEKGSTFASVFIQMPTPVVMLERHTTCTRSAFHIFFHPVFPG